MVSGRVGSYLRAVQSFGLGEVSLMSALGSCGCVSLYAVDLDGFEGWVVSLLICVEKGYGHFILEQCHCANTGMSPMTFCHLHGHRRACVSIIRSLTVGIT